ncbi:MAG: copper chaperone PCu(A)C [Luminiphilus sp.]
MHRPALFLLMSVLVFSPQTWAADLSVTNAWVRATPPGQLMTAAYATLQNTSNQTLVITGVTSDVTEYTSVHETLIDRDRATMRPVQQLTLNAGEHTDLAPGRTHIMLMKLSEPLTDGQSIDICFTLENNNPVCNEFSVTKHRASMKHH